MPLACSRPSTGTTRATGHRPRNSGPVTGGSRRAVACRTDLQPRRTQGRRRTRHDPAVGSSNAHGCSARRADQAAAACALSNSFNGAATRSDTLRRCPASFCTRPASGSGAAFATTGSQLKARALDVATVAAVAAVSDDDVVEQALLRAAARRMVTIAISCDQFVPGVPGVQADVCPGTKTARRRSQENRGFVRENADGSGSASPHLNAPPDGGGARTPKPPGPPIGNLPFIARIQLHHAAAGHLLHPAHFLELAGQAV